MKGPMLPILDELRFSKLKLESLGETLLYKYYEKPVCTLDFSVKAQLLISRTVW